MNSGYNTYPEYVTVIYYIRITIGLYNSINNLIFIKKLYTNIKLKNLVLFGLVGFMAYQPLQVI